MSSSKTYAIAGRGIAGLTAAYYMVKAGLLPTVYGRKDGSAQASRAAQGVLCNKGLIFYESPLFRAKIESLRSMQSFLEELEEVTGAKIPRFFAGVKEPIWSEDDFQSTVSRIYRHKFWGAHRTRFQTTAETHPETTKAPLGYLHYPSDGWFDPRAVLDALEIYLQAKGVRFLEKEIAALDTKDGVVTFDGESYDHLILATGAGIEKMWPELDCKALRMFLIGGQTLECPRGPGSQLSVQVKGNQSLALLPASAILGSTSWQGFESEDRALDEDKLRADIERNFGLRFPEGRSRQGVRMRFKDRMPLVGWLNTGKFAGKIYFLTGFYKNGMHLAEICAREMLFDITGEGDKRRYPEFSGQRFSV